MNQDITAAINSAAARISRHCGRAPQVGLILGSGLGVLGDTLQERTVIPYKDIPGFPLSTVEGHSGQLASGMFGSTACLAMQGRFHYYEGYSLREVTFPVRVMRALGISTLIITNAAGAVNTALTPGDLMLITDHLNLMGDNPLIGANTGGPRFPDMSEVYAKALREKAAAIANSMGIQLQQGVYAAMSGPTYETPAEIRMLRTLGADAVGMSTVPEAIVAVHAGMRVLGISCITNMAAGILDQPLSHDEVIETSEKARSTFVQFMQALMPAAGEAQ